MHRTTILSLAVASVCLSSAANAGWHVLPGLVPQTYLVQAPSEEDIGEYWSGVDPSVAMLGSVRQVIDSIRSKTAMPQNPLEYLEDTDNVQIIPFSALEGMDRDYDVTVRGDKSVDQALRENRETIFRIRDQLRTNFAAMRALETAGFTADQVLTWETSGTALLAIVVDDRGGVGEAPEQ